MFISPSSGHNPLMIIGLIINGIGLGIKFVFLSNLNYFLNFLYLGGLNCSIFKWIPGIFFINFMIKNFVKKIQR